MNTRICISRPSHCHSLYLFALFFFLLNPLHPFSTRTAASQWHIFFYPRTLCARVECMRESQPVLSALRPRLVTDCPLGYVANAWRSFHSLSQRLKDKQTRYKANAPLLIGFFLLIPLLDSLLFTFFFNHHVDSRQHHCRHS